MRGMRDSSGWQIAAFESGQRAGGGVSAKIALARFARATEYAAVGTKCPRRRRRAGQPLLRYSTNVSKGPHPR